MGGGPLVNAQCGTTANSTGTVASNTALVRSVMNPVTMTQNTDGSAPYKLKGTALGSNAAGGITGVALYAVSAQAVTAATRGETTYDATAGYYAKKTPIGCIDKSVRFNDIKVTATSATGTGKEMVYTFCDPSGFKGVSVATNTLAQNSALYREGDGVHVLRSVRIQGRLCRYQHSRAKQCPVQRRRWCTRSAIRQDSRASLSLPTLSRKTVPCTRRQRTRSLARAVLLTRGTRCSLVQPRPMDLLMRLLSQLHKQPRSARFGTLSLLLS